MLLVVAGASSEPRVRWDASGEVGGYADSDHVTVVTPALKAAASASNGLTAQGSYLVDVVSAASVDIVSTASPRWTEVRHAATLGAGYERGNLGASASGAASFEPDYVSLAGGLGASHAFAKRNVLLSLGYSYQHDVAGRTGTPFSVYALRLDRHTVKGRLEIVLARATTLTPAFDLMLESGRQEKPYRWLPLFDADDADSIPDGASIETVNRLRLPGRVAENLPEDRQRYAASARLAHRFQRSTLVLWDRAYLDSWGLLANTTDLRWVFELGPRWSLWPRLRFHEQGAVSFWRRAYVGSVDDGRVVVPRYRSGDRELGGLWTGTLGLGVGWDVAKGLGRSARVSLQVDGAYTDFRDTLYIDDRWSTFVVAGFSTRFQ